MNAPKRQITWEDLSPHLGCKYRKQGRFNWEGVRGRVHVFVNSEIAFERPIAVTVKFAVGSKDDTLALRDGIHTADQAPALCARLIDALRGQGVTAGESGDLATAISDFIQAERTAISHALAEAFQT